MMVAASIVTYNPELESLKQNLEALLDQVDVIFIVDNASDNISEIEATVKNLKQFDIVIKKYEVNRGLAYALNEAFILADQYCCEWLITMDQDSSISEGYVEECINIIKTNNDTKIGIVCPEVRDKNTYDANNTELQQINRENLSKEVACITSGSFTNVKAGIACGGFDNSMFIDQIDYDFCFNLIRDGFSIYKSNKIFINHELGRTERKKFFGLEYLTTNHSSKRLYYIYRNYFILRKKHCKQYEENQEVKEWFNKQGLRLLYRPVKILLSEKNKIHKLKSIISGVLDGIKIKTNN